MKFTLTERFSSEEKRSLLITDVVQLIETQVAHKKGLKALPLKGGLKMLNSLRPGALETAVTQMLGDFLGIFEPYFCDGEPSGALTSGKAHQEIAEALLEVSDRRASRVKNVTLLKLYSKTRILALEEVKSAVPELTQLLSK